jgi:hypothetical protein
MTSIHGDQDRTLSLDEEHRLDNLEREENSIEASPHTGFADAIRVTKLKSEIEALEEHNEREKQLEE